MACCVSLFCDHLIVLPAQSSSGRSQEEQISGEYLDLGSFTDPAVSSTCSLESSFRPFHHFICNRTIIISHSFSNKVQFRCFISLPVNVTGFALFSLLVLRNQGALLVPRNQSPVDFSHLSNGIFFCDVEPCGYCVREIRWNGALY